MATCPTCRKRYPDNVTTCEVDGERLLPNEAFSGADADLAAGLLVGEYQIEAKIGEGGFGSVYRAVHPVIGKAAAIKVLNRQYSSNPQMVSRFISEARAVNQIRNRNIIDIFSFGTLDDGRQYYVMELLEGLPLDRYLKQKGRIGPEEAIPILRGVARALDAAHAAGVAHRDLKPENIFLMFEDDGAVFPKLLDFGIAKLLGDGAMSFKTRTGQPIGTPYYMSPEQCRGKQVDHRTDIYSFGIVVHETLTGRMPFTGDNVMDLLLKQTTVDPPTASSVCPELSPLLDAPILEMLRKDPDTRPPTAGAAIEALARAAQDAGYAVQAMSTPGSGPGLRPSGGAVAVGARSGMTPADIKSISDAATLVDVGTGSRTLLNAASDVTPAGRRRMAVIIAAVSLVAATALTATIVSRGAPADLPPAMLARLPSAPTVAPFPAPAASPSVTPAEPSEVEVTIQSTPKEVDVYIGSEKIGSSAGPLKLKRGDAPVTLTLKATGHAPAQVEIVPSANVVVPAKLVRLRARPEIEF